MTWIQERGLRVPEDVSVVGFDGTAQEYSIPISSVRQPAYEVGLTAARFVGAMANGEPAANCRVVLPVAFAPSSSTGPVPINKQK
jgi:DNA-binding LacI/PurR family transcriptional regulator